METINKQKKIAFVASGGAVKAACFHLGVCLALLEKGFKFQGGSIATPNYGPKTENLIDTYVGSSAGAIISSYLSVGFTPEEILNAFAEKNTKDSRLKKISYWQMLHIGLPIISSSIKMLKKKHSISASGGLEAVFRNYLTLTGLASAKGIEEYLSENLLFNGFNDLAADLFVVATQLNYSKRTIFGKFSSLQYLSEKETCHYTHEIPISQAVAASAALPPFYRPYRVTYPNGEKVDYFDGEIRKTLSTHVAKDVGADLIIASYTHQPYHFTEEVGSLADYGMTSIVIQAIYQTIEQKIATVKNHYKKISTVIDTINKFFIDNQLPDEKRKTLVAQIEQVLDHKKNIRYIYIHPQPHNYEMFFGDHFNLSPKIMEAQMKIGFRAGLHALTDL